MKKLKKNVKMTLSKNHLENKPILLEQHSATATISKAIIKF